jgi:hypothetical protein
LGSLGCTSYHTSAVLDTISAECGNGVWEIEQRLD